MTGWVKGYLLLGSNLGDRAGQITRAMTALHTPQVRILESSDMYQTAPWGVEDQPVFLNSVVAYSTSLSPLDLWNHCRNIEVAAGPRKQRHWGERHLDIDILYYGQRVLHHPSLSVPHPRIADRLFTLVPLVQIASEWLHPQYLLTQSALLQRCTDTLSVEKWQDHAA